jgi:hypothetical protein
MRHWSFRAGVFLVLLILAALQLRIAMREQAEYSGAGESAAMIDSLRSPFLLTWHGKRLHLLEGEMAEAEELFKRALVHNSLFIPAWLGLAELQNDRGKQAESRAILDYVDPLSAGINRWRWEKALLTYQLGRYDSLSEDLAWIIEKIPGKSQDALKMAFSVWPEPTELLSRIGRQNILQLFSYASRTKKVDTALAYWPQIEVMGVEAHRQEVLAFLDSLIQDGRLAEAVPIWRRYFNGESLLYNGNFGQEPSNTAFDWRVGKPKGSTWRIETSGGRDGQAMRLHFSGTENIRYSHLSQIVPLAPGKKYLLNGQIKTDRLTTDQRPFLEVAGFQCTMPQARTRVMAESQPWTAFSLTFDVPEGCRAVQVRVRREPSDRLDNLLAGDLWLKDMAIEAIGDISVPPVVVK